MVQCLPVTYTISDGAGGLASATLTLGPVVSVNDAPAGTDATLSAIEDTAYLFSAADFGFTDPNDAPANGLQSVIITSLPASGVLTLGGVAVVAGQTIPAAQIATLAWMPPAHANGAGLTSFTFQIVDDGGMANGGVNTDASPNMITFDVSAVNDAPIAVNDTVTVTEDTPVSGSVLANDTDVDGNPLAVTQFTYWRRDLSVRHQRSVAGRHAGHRSQWHLQLRPGRQLQRPCANGDLHNQ